LTAKALNDKGQVALILGVLGSSITTDRTNGFKAAIAKYPGISIVAQPNDNWTNSLNIQVVQELTSRYSNGGLNAIVGEGFQMFAGADWAYTHGIKNIQFISGDYAVQTEAAIKSGALYGSVEQDPGQQGTLAVQYAYDWLTGHRSDVPQPIAYTPLPMITKSNVAKYPSTWSA
jgi:ribose transport system substrate-binding protein